MAAVGSARQGGRAHDGEGAGGRLSPRIIIRRTIERRATLEDRAADAQRRLLKATQREILAELRSAGGYKAQRLRSILAVVDRWIGAGRTTGAQAATVHAREAWKLGIQLADAGMPSADLYDLSAELLRSLVKVTRDSVRDVWNELGSKLKTNIRRTVLGLADPQDAMQAVSKVIKDPKGFGSPHTRAEVIVRTEVNRVFSSATQERFDQAIEAGVKLRKYWLSAEDDRVRPDHAKAAQRYSKGNAIRADEPFSVGGAKLLYPGDPSGPPEQTINCRCCAVPLVVD